VGILAVLAWVLLCPYDAPLPQTALVALSPHGQPSASTALPLAAFEPVWRLDLRRPLSGEAVLRPALGLKLRGTVMEPGHCMAMLITPDGRTQLVPVGGEVAGGKVLEIDKDSVKLLFNGETILLQIPKDGQS
jgi:hypothetical protein